MDERPTEGSAAGADAPAADPSAYRRRRSELLDRHVDSRDERRRALSLITDTWLAEVFAGSGAVELGACLLAVGGYGRGELTPGSDLDLVLVLPDRVDVTDSGVAQVVERLWYPVWDSGVRIDHSVRTPAEVRRVAARDMRAILGLLDARVVAGDVELGQRVAATVLADWRGTARTRLGELRDSVAQRRGAAGDAAHLLEPDLKESYGGLRDAAILDAIAASWITDVPREGLDAARSTLLDIRDALHESALRDGRRPTDVLRTQDQSDVAAIVGLEGRDSLLRELGEACRSIAYACDTTWHRVGRITRTRTIGQVRRRLRRPGPERVPLADGVVVHDGEVALALDARPDRDPVLVLRLAAAAAQAGLPVAPGTLTRLAREAMPLPVPWPRDARDGLVSLLGAGPSLVPVWEALDQHGLIARMMPEWEAVRSLPQGNPVHRYRVDRHLVQTAAEAAPYLRDVSRPDLLLIGALLHDIGKGQPGDHSETGAVIAQGIARDMGFDESDRGVLVALVRHHLLLADTATRRDLEDPLTARQVADAVASPLTLELLRALTRADAAATGPGAWSDWKAGLVDELTTRSAAVLAGVEAPAAPQLADRYGHLLASPGIEVILEAGDPVTRVVIAAPDRAGLLATIAGVLSLHRLEVTSADTQTVDGRALMAWVVRPFFGDLPSIDLLRADLVRALAGELDVTARLAHRRPATISVPPRVDFVAGAASEADVLEVRAHDEPALVHRIGAALEGAGALIIAARIETLGSEAVDVFYLQGRSGARLTDNERGRILDEVRTCLAQGDGQGAAATA